VSAEAYPLQWPQGRARTNQWGREHAKFDVSFARARDNIIREVTLLAGGRYGPDPQVVISTNIPLRRDGLPLAGHRAPDDPGVAVYFLYKKRQMSFACDRWYKIEHNMQAIAKTIEALRGVARWGTGDMLEAAFTGFTALPPPAAGAQGRTQSATGATYSGPACARAPSCRTCIAALLLRSTLIAAATPQRWPNSTHARDDYGGADNPYEERRGMGNEFQPWQHRQVHQSRGEKG
jgi:hypothetical protein